MIILLWISRLTTSVYTTRGIYALVLDLQREDKVWPRFPSVAGSSWFFPSGQLGSRQSGAVYVLPDERVSVNAIRPVYVLVDGNSSQTTKARLLLVIER